MTAQIVIVVPPFADAAWPALGPSLLAEGCRQHGMSATVYYANMRLAARIGYERYEQLSLASSLELPGEALFAAWAFDGEPSTSHTQAIMTRLYAGRNAMASGLDAELTLADALDVATYLGPFLDECVTGILQLEASVVGFSSVFQQTLSSLALARRLKAQRPDILTVVGGSNASQPMGDAIAGMTDVFDVIFSGEADFAFPAFCRRYLSGDERPERRVVECEAVTDMDRVETPNYDDYFEQLAALQQAGTLPAHLPEALMYESSRGCWYGAKSHCKFCGLNGLEISYRRKSSARVLREIDALVANYRLTRLQATDNIMPHQFRHDVLPALAERQELLQLQLFYEVKSNLTADDLDKFVQAGVTKIQPGIESLSSHVLKLMAKGVTGVRNLCTLRECASRQVAGMWNIIYGFPGETRDDYEAMLAIFPYIEHLRAPDGFGRVRFDRYSPYFEQAAAHGIRNLRPLPVYEQIFPAGTNLDDLAYSFEGTYSTELLDDIELTNRFRDAVFNWKTLWQSGKVAPQLSLMLLGDDLSLVHDTRACAQQTYTALAPEETQLLRELEKPIRCDQFDEPREPILQTLLDAHFVIEYEHHYLSIVIDPIKGLRLRPEDELTGSRQA